MAKGGCSLEPCAGGAIEEIPMKSVCENDQHMQCVIKNVTSQPGRKLDCDEPALYVHARWQDLKKSNRILVVELEKAGIVLLPDKRKILH